MKGKNNSELVDLTENLKRLIDLYPKSVFILGFRSEFYTDIRKFFQSISTRKKEFQLNPLHRSGMIKAIELNETIREEYKIEIQPELPENMIDYILQDRNSSHTTILLQTLLDKIWDWSIDRREFDFSPVKFTLQSFDHIKQPSFEEMLDEQLYTILTSGYYLESENGLVLDILHYYTTDLSTAATRLDSDFEERYSKEITHELIKELKKIQLLSSLKIGQEPATRLAHDTLAPFIIKRYNSSQALWQKVKRHLDYALKTNVKLNKEGLLDILNSEKQGQQFSFEENQVIEEAKQRYYKVIIGGYIEDNNIDKAFSISLSLFLEKNISNKYFEVLSVIAMLNFFRRQNINGLFSFEIEKEIKNNLNRKFLRIAFPLQTFEKEDIYQNINLYLEEKNPKVKTAISLLKNYFEELDNKELVDELILISAEYENLKFNEQEGLITIEDYSRILKEISIRIKSISNLNLQAKTFQIENSFDFKSNLQKLQFLLAKYQKGKLELVLKELEILFSSLNKKSLLRKTIKLLNRFQLIEYKFLIGQLDDILFLKRVNVINRSLLKLIRSAEVITNEQIKSVYLPKKLNNITREKTETIINSAKLKIANNEIEEALMSLKLSPRFTNSNKIDLWLDRHEFINSNFYSGKYSSGQNNREMNKLRFSILKKLF